MQCNAVTSSSDLWDGHSLVHQVREAEDWAIEDTAPDSLHSAKQPDKDWVATKDCCQLEGGQWTEAIALGGDVSVAARHDQVPCTSPSCTKGRK